MRAGPLLLASLLAALPLSSARGDEPLFKATVVPPDDVRVGKPATVAVDVAIVPGMHMNLEYPAGITLPLPEGLDGPKGKVKPVKVERRAARFEVSFTPRQAGEKKLAGKAKFAICKDDNSECRPLEAPVQLVVVVR